MNGDRLVLVGHLLMILVIASLAIIAFLEKDKIAFLIWSVFLALFIIIPLIVLNVLKHKYHSNALEKLLHEYTNLVERSLHLEKRKRFLGIFSLIHHNFSQLFSSIKSIFRKRPKEIRKLMHVKKEESKHIESKHVKTEPKTHVAVAKEKPLKIAHKKEIPKAVAEKRAEPEFIATSGTVQTDFDKIVEYTKEKKEVSISDVAKHFKLPREKIEEWAKILAEHGLIEIVYPTFGDARLKAIMGSK